MGTCVRRVVAAVGVAFALAVVDVCVGASPAGAAAGAPGAPDTVIEQGPAGTTGDPEAVFAFSADEAEALFACRLDGGMWTPCRSPESYDALPDGEHTFEVRAESGGPDLHGPGEVDPTPASRTWTIDSGSASDSYQGTAPAGGMVSSDPAEGGASADDPLTTDVTVPAGGPVTITEQPATTSAPDGYDLFGPQARITAPDGSAADPLRLVFTLDASAIPAETDPAAVMVLRDGAPAADCTDSAAADPDPCVAARQSLAGGDVQLTVLSSRASTWNFAERTASPPAGGEDGSGDADPLAPVHALLADVLRQLAPLIDPPPAIGLATRLGLLRGGPSW